MITFYLVVMTLFFLVSAGYAVSENKDSDAAVCFAFGIWPLIILVARLA